MKVLADLCIVPMGTDGPSVSRYVREINDGEDHALVFEAAVDGKKITGCDFIHVNAEGKIDDFMVMVRPLSAAQALSAAMGAQFAAIAEEATATAQVEAAGTAGA